MKKMVLGLAVCWCVTVGGMENEKTSKIKELVSSVVVHPEDSAELRELVEILSDSEEGTETAMECCNNLSTATATVEFQQIASMLQAIRRDWSEYGYSMPVDYYIKGAFSGKFGPYNIPDDVEFY